MILKIIKIIAIALSVLLLILFCVAYAKVDKASSSKLKDVWKGFLGLSKQTSSNGLLGSKAVQNSTTNTPKRPTTINNLISSILST